jgi:hypothetical protein
MLLKATISSLPAAMPMPIAWLPLVPLARYCDHIVTMILAVPFAIAAQQNINGRKVFRRRDRDLLSVTFALVT